MRPTMDWIDAFRAASERVRLIELEYSALPRFRVEIWKSLKGETFDCTVTTWNADLSRWEPIRSLTQSGASANEALDRTMVLLKAELESGLGKDPIA